MTNIVAVGYAHKPNFLKFRILEALYNADHRKEGPLTTHDIERLTGIDHTKISAAMSRYQKIHKKNGNEIKLPYIRRLEQKGPHGLYRYTITKRGREAYGDYHRRIQAGLSLLRVRSGYMKKMETYGKFKIKYIKSPDNNKLLDEQLLPYYSFTTAIKESYANTDIDKSMILQAEEIIRQKSIKN